MQTLLKKFYITLITFSLFSFVGCTQVPAKESGKEEKATITNSTPVQSEQGTNINTRSTTVGPCVSRLEKNETEAIMDTITSIVHVDFYCLCSDYLTDVKVKLSNKERTYDRITDKLGCDFMHIQPGRYRLEVDYESAKKFKPMEIEVKSGHISNWKIFLCEE
jgi:hypothetical protein